MALYMTYEYMAFYDKNEKKHCDYDENIQTFHECSPGF